MEAPDPIETHQDQHSRQGFAGEPPGRIQPGRSNHNIESGTPPNAKPSAACGHRVHNRQELRTAPRAGSDSAYPAAHNRHASPVPSTPAPPAPARPPAAATKEIWQSSVALRCPHTSAKDKGGPPPKASPGPAFFDGLARLAGRGLPLLHQRPMPAGRLPIAAPVCLLPRQRLRGGQHPFGRKQPNSVPHPHPRCAGKRPPVPP